MDLSRPLTESERGQSFLLGTTDQFSKPVCSVLLQTTTATDHANAFLDHSVYAYSATAYVLTDTEKRPAVKFFDAFCAMIEVKNYLTDVYNPRQVRRPSGLIKPSYNVSAMMSKSMRGIGTPVSSPSCMPRASKSSAQQKRLRWTWSYQGIRLVLIMTGVSSHGRGTNTEENTGPVQYKRATLRRLRSVPVHALLKLSAAQRRYKSDLDCKANFRPVINGEDFEYVSRPLRALTKAERR